MSKTERAAVAARNVTQPPKRLMEAIARSREADVASARARAEQRVRNVVVVGAIPPDSAPAPAPRPVYELLGAIGELAVDNAQRIAVVSDALVPADVASCRNTPKDVPCAMLIGEQLALVFDVLQWTRTRLDEMHAALHGGTPAKMWAPDQFAADR